MMATVTVRRPVSHDRVAVPIAHPTAKGGGAIYVCSPCFKKRKLDENNLVAGASIVGGAKLVEFLSDGSPCVTF